MLYELFGFDIAKVSIKIDNAKEMNHFFNETVNFLPPPYLPSPFFYTFAQSKQESVL